ncbi:hypothetical protein Cni_G03101 [Canna indica]|uniref:FLZ-type domain-containing protein n=1 Tax=Canna indica TaxID=4628 RepID=A0AAQ3JQG9_9LILI|nr:hypothetical protein Cni_G03101 [Canna indica]
MPSRSKSIFHLGDDGGEAATKVAKSSKELIKSMKRATEAGAAEGLRILIDHNDHQGANIVINKPTMKACTQLIISQSCLLPKGGMPVPALDFLKRCCLCKKELKPCKDVFMYRGDQGFCSKECRYRQIMMDERREFEKATRNRSKAHHHRRLSAKLHESDRNRRIPALA